MNKKTLATMMVAVTLGSSSLCYGGETNSTDNKQVMSAPKELIEYISRDTKLKGGLKLKEFKLIGKEKLKDDLAKNWEKHTYKITIENTNRQEHKDFYKIIFVNEVNGLIAPKLFNYKTKKTYGIKKSAPKTKKKSSNTKDANRYKIYKNKRLVSGNRSAKHKIAVFTNPMCGYCQEYTPKLISYGKKNPDKLGVYYYGVPFTGEFRSETLVRLHIANEMSDDPQDILSAIYEVGKKLRSQKDKTEEEIIEEVYKKAGAQTVVSKSDLHSKKVDEIIKKTKNAMSALGARKTPTVVIDGVISTDKNAYIKLIEGDTNATRK